jgi:tetratricopeptide (TPR) repeat protein
MSMTPETTSLIEKAKTDFGNKQFEQAAEEFQACLDLLSSNDGDLLEIAEQKNNLSVALLRCNKAQAALDAVIGTEKVFETAGDKQKQGMALANTASAYESLKQIDLAVEAYQGAIDCFKASGDKKLRSITLKNLSDLQLRTGNQYVALATLKASYENKPNAGLKDKFFATAIGRVIQKLLGQ